MSAQLRSHRRARIVENQCPSHCRYSEEAERRWFEASGSALLLELGRSRWQEAESYAVPKRQRPISSRQSSPKHQPASKSSFCELISCYRTATMIRMTATIATTIMIKARPLILPVADKENRKLRLHFEFAFGLTVVDVRQNASPGFAITSDYNR